MSISQETRIETKLFPYQLEGVALLEKYNGRALLADQMGLGKSLQCLYYLYKHPEATPAIVVCPATLKWVWQREAKIHLQMRSQILEGRTPKKKGLLQLAPLVIINYDILPHWLDHLLQYPIKTLIIDECHYIKSRTAIRTKAVAKLAAHIPRVIAVSGTPLTNRPAELFNTLKILWPQTFKSFWSFAFEYCKPVRKPWGWEFKGASNLSKLHKQLKELGMIRRLKADVLSELPEKIREVIQVSLEDYAPYREAVSNFLQWLSQQSPEKAVKAAKAEKLVKMGYLKRLAAELKMKSVFQWLDDFLEGTEEKLVVYCCHQKILDMLVERYADICVAVDGRTSVSKRKIAVTSFQEGNKRLFIGNILAAGTGITLTAASTLAFVELDWVPSNCIQAEDRIHRIGQKNAATIYYIVAKDTIEQYLCEIIQKKQQIVSNVLDGSRLKEALQVYDLILQKMEKEHQKRGLLI